ncbi:hypothetical protein HU200_026941 [Digitaria exilis]|uniref:RIN4 pathogenic type III effector avirulence factor Avr cleavage site domain-containing protein n=1 Tax=Digitaria exilis TaxID=1010633 RepID=A0A835EVE2_9POAL|nr:hypothetical protein HU200_026941 [Digitaria exilis]
MANPGIPAFGDWENTGNTPYTQKFEDARKNKNTGTPAQPNDPRRNPEPTRKSPLQQTAYKTNPQDHGPRNPPHRSRPETDHQRHSDHQTHRESAPRRHSNAQREGGNASAPRSPYRAAAGSASPMQPNNQSKPKNRSTGGVSSEGHGQHTPGRSRMKPSGFEPEEEVAVPPFGEWDDANAASGEKYTGIFNRVRDDRLSPNTSARQPSTTRREENKAQQDLQEFWTTSYAASAIRSLFLLLFIPMLVVMFVFAGGIMYL